MLSKAIGTEQIYQTIEAEDCMDFGILSHDEDFIFDEDHVQDKKYPRLKSAFNRRDENPHYAHFTPEDATYYFEDR